MDDPGDEKAPKFFEITVPPDVDQDRISKLLGKFAAREGLPLYERPAEEVITTKTLCATSEMTWGKTSYGSLASGILGSLRKSIMESGKVQRERNGAINVIIPALNLTGGAGAIGNITLPPDQIEQEAMRVLKDLDSPFELILTEPRIFSEQFVLNGITPLPPTKRRLARWLQATGLYANELHGANGKALDVLARAAGLPVESDPTEREWGGKFIDAEGLWSHLREAGLTVSQIDGLNHKITAATRRQTSSGAPDEYGEVIVELENRARESPLSPKTWDFIAVASLANLGASYQRRSAVPPAALRRLSKELS